MEEKFQTCDFEDNTDTDTALWVLSQLKSAKSMIRSQCFEKAVAFASEAIALCSSSSSATLFPPTSPSSLAKLSTCWATISTELLPCEPDLAPLDRSAVLFVGHSLRGQALLYLGDQEAEALEDFSVASQLRPADRAALRYRSLSEAAVRRDRDRAALHRHLRSCCGKIGQGDTPCPRDALLECDGCREIGLSRRVRARYCGEECRAAAFPSHALFHRMFRRPRRSGCGVAETCCLAMLELAAVDELPAPAQDGTLTLLVLEGSEGQQHLEEQEKEQEEADWMGEFVHLGELLRRFVYPDSHLLRRLQVLLSGPGGARARKTTTAGYPDLAITVTVTVRCISLAEEQVLSAALTCQVCFLLCPGFFSLFFPPNSHGNQHHHLDLDRQGEGPAEEGLVSGWQAAVVQALLCAAKPLPVVVTSRAVDADKATDRDREMDKDGHALFDEDCLREFWGAHILTPTSFNPGFDPRPQREAEYDPFLPDAGADPLNKGRRNRFYTIAKGQGASVSVRVRADREEGDGDGDRRRDLKRQLAIGYLRMRAGRAASYRLRSALLRLAQDLLSGAVPYTGQSVQQLMDTAALRSDLT